MDVGIGMTTFQNDDYPGLMPKVGCPGCNGATPEEVEHNASSARRERIERIHAMIVRSSPKAVSTREVVSDDGSSLYVPWRRIPWLAWHLCLFFAPKRAPN